MSYIIINLMAQNIFQEIDALQTEIHSHRPISPDLLKQLKEYYKIGLTYSSNALEGNEPIPLIFPRTFRGFLVSFPLLRLAMCLTHGLHSAS
jgi:hypothetical protein